MHDLLIWTLCRDFNYMTGLAIVQACLAINFYKALPESLINRVFNIDFIKRIEDEIEMCYSKVIEIIKTVQIVIKSICDLY